MQELNRNQKSNTSGNDLEGKEGNIRPLVREDERKKSSEKTMVGKITTSPTSQESRPWHNSKESCTITKEKKEEKKFRRSPDALFAGR